MPRSPFTFHRLALVILFVLPLFEARAVAPSPTDQVNAVVDALTRGCAARDPIAVMSHFVKTPGDALVVFDIAPPLEDIGYESNLAKLRAFFGGLDGPIVLEWRDRKVTVDHNHAFVIAHLYFAATSKSGAKIEQQARSTLVLQRIGGDWLIVHEHDSVPAEFKIPGYGDAASGAGAAR